MHPEYIIKLVEHLEPNTSRERTWSPHPTTIYVGTLPAPKMA